MGPGFPRPGEQALLAKTAGAAAPFNGRPYRISRGAAGSPQPTGAQDRVFMCQTSAGRGQPKHRGPLSKDDPGRPRHNGKVWSVGHNCGNYGPVDVMPLCALKAALMEKGRRPTPGVG